MTAAPTSTVVDVTSASAVDPGTRPEASTPTAASGPASTTTHGSGAAGTGPADDDRGGTLPRTGAVTIPIALAGVVLVAIGLWLVRMRSLRLRRG